MIGKGKYIAKLAMVVFIIFTMMFSNIMPLIAWAEENISNDTTTEDEYVKYNLTWNSDAITEQDTINGTVGSAYIGHFKLDFNTIKSGFENFEVVVEGQSGVIVDFASVNTIGNGTPFSSFYGNTLKLQENTSAGTVVTGNIKFTFLKKENEDYIRNINVKLIGEYELDGQTVYVNETKTLKAILTEQFYINSYTISFPTTDNRNKDYTVSYDGIKTITKNYYLQLQGGGPYVQSSKITVTGLKAGSSETNNLPMEFKLNQSSGYTLEEFNQETGTAILSKGDSSASREDAQLSYLADIIVFTVSYNLTGENGKISGPRGLGYYFNLDINASAEVFGYDYYNGAGGETFTARTVNKQANHTTSEFVPNSSSFGVDEAKYGTNFEKTKTSITQGDIDNLLENGSLDVSYRSYMNFQNVTNKTIGKLYAYNYDFTEDDVNIEGIKRTAKTLNNEKTYIYYQDSQGKYQSKHVQAKVKSINFSNIEKAEEGAQVKFYKRGDVEGEDEPFFIASKSNLTYTADENSNITEYYAVYDTSNIEGDCYWLANNSTNWTTNWTFEKEDLGLTDEEITTIYKINKYQEGVVVKDRSGLTARVKYTHNENWKEVDNISENVSCDLRVYFDMQSDNGITFSSFEGITTPEGEELTKDTDYIKVKNMRLTSISVDADIKIYAKDAEEGVDEPLAILNKDNKVYTPTEDFIDFYIVEDIQGDLRELYNKGFELFVEYEANNENLDLLGDEVPNVSERITAIQDSNTYTYDEISNSITETVKGTISDVAYNLITEKKYASNHSVTYLCSYGVQQNNYYSDLTGTISGVSLNSVGVTTSTRLEINQDDRYPYDAYSIQRLKNPVIYVELSNDFEYDYESFKAYAMGGYFTIEKTDFKLSQDGEKVFFVMYLNGEYIGKGEGMEINISFDKRLKPKVTATNQEAFLIYMTDEYEDYLITASDTYDLDEDGNTTELIFRRGLSYDVYSNDGVVLKNNIKNEEGEVYTPKAIISKGKKATVQLITENNYTSYSMSNMSIVARLPFIGNKSIKDKTTRIGEDGKEIDAEFLGNINVYYQDDNKLDTKFYKIGYSSEELADFDTEYTFIEQKQEYTEEEQEIIKNAKTIKIEFVNYNVLRGYSIKLEYDIKIPDDATDDFLAGEQFAIKYNIGTNEQNVESAPAYIVVGEPKTTTLKITKTFQGTNPTESKENIEFSIQGVDNLNTYTGVTNADGIATIEGILPGMYKVTEITEFENYRNDQVKFFEANEFGDAKELEIENPLKTANITVYKKWENTNKQVQTVRLNIQGTTVSGDSYSSYSWTYSDGRAVFYSVPYGTYTITEVSTVAGWYSEPIKDVIVNQESITKDLQNKLAYGNLQINKTVPEGDTVEGLKFRLYGIGFASYLDDNNNLIQMNVDEEIVIGADGKGTLSNIPLGRYTLEEIEMPEIDSETGKVTRYIPIKRDVTISERNNTTIVNVENKWKTGTLDIKVTATEGTELDQFKVKITGTTYYGTTIQEEYDIPENGEISVDVPIGEYTVEECNTKEVEGKILTIKPDGYEVTYNPEGVNKVPVKIEYKDVVDVLIHNEYVGKGIVKIEKTLEGEEDVSKAAGIQFKIKGKDAVGNDVEKIITIGEDGTGTSDEIPVGTYLLSEVEETVPAIYTIAEEKEITITTANTSENPLVLPIENKLAIGNIIMETELKEGGYPKTPVTYSVTKVDDNLEKIEDSIEIVGDRNSHAELDDVKAGKYLIEQKIIPEGYIKDTRQVVNITRSENGYALFIIEKEEVEEFENTKIIINKQIVNSEGNEATEEDFEKAEINKQDKYSFEVKIQNVDTKQIYYSFVDNKNSDTIIGLPYGTYEIEEVYKPKFKMLEIAGERLQLDDETGKYTFTLSEDNEQIENTVVINIKNQINTEFGFGGQDSKDNLSKVLVEEAEKIFVTKAKVYVRDDEDNRISDSKFKLYDSNGNIVKFAGSQGEYISTDQGNEEISPVDGSITFKALPVGEYKLVNTEVNESYLTTYDRVVTVYESAVGITRIELLRNIPRGSLRLSTMYTDNLGEEHYVSNSKYKILDPVNDEVLTFIKKADGTYERSNLPNATDKITLKAGYVDVNGIEAGVEYQVGLVDVVDEYGIIKDEVEFVTVEENQNKEVKVSVEDRTNMFVKVLTKESGTTIALDKKGKIWMYDSSYYSYFGLKNNYELQCINDIEQYATIKDVRFKEIDIKGQGGYSETFVAIDTEGKVWTWGANYSGELGDGTTTSRLSPVCISDIEGNGLSNIKMKKVAVGADNSNCVFVLDEQGKIWFWGKFNQQNGSDIWLENSNIPVCINELCDLKDVLITDICDLGYYGSMILIDTQGKVWSFGYNSYGELGIPTNSSTSYIKPTCISDIEGISISNVKIKKAATGDDITFLIDTENRLWGFGTPYNGTLGIGVDNTYNGFWSPICLNENNDSNPLNGIGIVDVSCNNDTVCAIDENGKIWSWGYESNGGELGLGFKYYDVARKNYSTLPICISDIDNNELDNVKIVDVYAANSNNAAAIDENGNIWVWGNQYLPMGMNLSSTPVPPTKISISTNAHFEIPNFVKVDAGYYHSLAIDEEGRVWAWGHNNQYVLGIGYKPEISSSTTPLLVGQNSEIGKVKIVDISAGNQHSLAIDSEGNLWAWGYNDYGQFGISKDQLFGSYYAYTPICISKMIDQENALYGKKIEKIYTGERWSAVIDSEGKLYTFGYNCYGQIGDGTSGSSEKLPVCLNNINSDLENVKFVDASIYKNVYHIMALDSEGNIWTWGYNYSGQLGFSSQFKSSTGYSSPYCITKEEGNPLYGIKFKQVSTGYEHSLALDEEGKVWTWGYSAAILSDSNTYVANCLTIDQNNKLYNKKICNIYAGTNMSLVIDEEGKIWTWGINNNGSLGQNTTNTTPGINCINNNVRLTAKDVSVGNNYVLVQDTKGDLWSWGNSIVNGREAQAILPLRLKGETEIVNEVYNQTVDKITDAPTETYVYGIIEKKDSYTYPEDIKQSCTTNNSHIILDKSGNLWTYGNNTYGELGDGTLTSREEPKVINDMMDGKSIESILSFSDSLIIVKDIDGDIWLWGKNDYGEATRDSADSAIVNTPICISKEYNIKVKSIQQSSNTMIVLDENDKLWIWGLNSYGQCGIPSSESNKIINPNQIGSFTVKHVIRQGTTMIIQDTDGIIYAWGGNTYGMCGVGSSSYEISTPTPINYVEGTGKTFELEELKDVILNSNTSAYLDAEGNLWMCGLNGNGQCGTGNTQHVTALTCVNKPYGFTIKEVLVRNNSYLVVVDTEGKLWSWGYNGYGHLGTGTTGNVLVPTCISETNNIIFDKKIVASTTMIIQDTQNRVWAWGLNTQGQCGTGTNTNVLTPTQINTDNNMVVDYVLNLANYLTIFVHDTEGNLWAWGQNTQGKCGTGTATNILTPTKIITKEQLDGAKITEILNSGNYPNYISVNTVVAKDDKGRIWTWGKNDYGQCGTGSEETFATPKCINEVNGLENVKFKSILIYGATNRAVDEDDKLWLWGRNQDGYLGLGSQETIIRTPVCRTDYFEQIGLNLKESISSSSTSYVLDTNGDIWTWGVNTYGQCGTGTTDTVYVPTCITKDLDLEYDSIIVADSNHIILKDTKGKLWSWGLNTNGECGAGTTENVLVPTCISDTIGLIVDSEDKYYTYRYASYLYTYILKQNGDVYAFGNGILTPTKLNDLEGIDGAKIKAIGVNYQEEKIDLLSEDGIIYKVSNTLEVENLMATELIGSYGVGPWKNEFKIVANTNYSK